MIDHLAALAASGVSLVLAVRRRWLTGRATATAALVGTAVWVGTGPPGVGVLLFFFVSSSVASRLPGRPSDVGDAALSGDADRATADRGEEGGEEGRPRRARQVLANGGVAAAAAVALPAPSAAVAVVGALAAATADTWSSEIGRVVGGATWRASSGARVRPGTPGGVSVAGSAAAVAGAAAVGVVAAALGLWPSAAGAGRWAGGLAAAVGAGVTGAALDSVLGAAADGAATRRGNDVVNLAATAAGAAVAVGIAAAVV